jgi:hypothetical protein
MTETESRNSNSDANSEQSLKASRGVADSTTRRFGAPPTLRLAEFSFKHSKADSPSRRVSDSPTRRVGELATPPHCHVPLKKQAEN